MSKVLPECMTEPKPLSKAELDELDRLSQEAISRPWQVDREPLKRTKLGEEHGLKGNPPLETTIHTAWDHGQLKGPAPVITTASGPFYVPNRAVHIEKKDADFIVAACNATWRLVDEVRNLRELATIVRDQLVPIVEMDNEANDPSTDLFVAMYRIKDLLDATELPTEESK
jgi:hypothetical protein